MDKERKGRQVRRGKIRDRKPKKIYPEKLVEYIKINPDAYLSEIADNFNCSTTAVLKALKKLNITRKNRQLHTKNNVVKKQKNI